MADEELNPDISMLDHYTRIKQGIAYEIRTLSEFLKNHLGEGYADDCRELMVKLADDRFVLSVVGQYKRGKSTLMNAIIEQDILPTGVLPLTSAITVLKFGPEEKLTIVKQGTLRHDEVPVSSLADYVTEKGNPGNMKKVAYALLEMPSRFLRKGLEFVDTPGIGSSIEANTETTYSFVPLSDAVIFVTGIDTPLTGAETDFLQSIRENVRKIFFVVNKIDLIEETERGEILNFISENVKLQTGAEEIRIFPVSSTRALESKLDGDETGYGQSGVKILKEALSDFLSREKISTLMISVLDKSLHLAADALHELHLLKAAREITREEVQETTTALENRFQILRDQRRNSLKNLREHVIPWARERISANTGSFIDREREASREKIDEFLSESDWKLSRKAVGNIGKNLAPAIKKDVDEFAKHQADELDRELLDILGREWGVMERELKKISSEAAEVLGITIAETAFNDEGSRLPFTCRISRPTFTKIEWKPELPHVQAWLPVFMMRSSLKEILLRESERYVRRCIEILDGGFIEEINELLGRVAHEMETQAEMIETNIVQAVKGERLRKDISGKRQTVRLEREELEHEIRTLEKIIGKLVSVRAEILGKEPVQDPATALPEESSTRMAVLGPIFSGEKQGSAMMPGGMNGTEEETDFRKDLETRGCPVCNRMIETALKYYARWQNVLATRENAQRSFAVSRGFCPLHTWQFASMSSPQGLSQGYPALMERFSRDLSRIAASGASEQAASILSLVQNSGHCPVCGLIKNAEERYIEGLAGFVQGLGGKDAYLSSHGVCLHHLGRLVAVIPAREISRILIEHASRRFAEISEDMQNYTLKRDAFKWHTTNKDEEDAYLRGLIHSVGAKRLCSPWEPDGGMKGLSVYSLNPSTSP